MLKMEGPVKLHCGVSWLFDKLKEYGFKISIRNRNLSSSLDDWVFSHGNTDFSIRFGNGKKLFISDTGMSSDNGYTFQIVSKYGDPSWLDYVYYQEDEDEMIIWRYINKTDELFEKLEKLAEKFGK